MPLYSMTTRSAPVWMSMRERFSTVISSGLESVRIITLRSANWSGSYSSSPSSQTSSSVRSPLQKRLSSSVSWINFVLPASRKPVNR